MSLRLPVLVVLLALTAGGCGMRGPLYLPGPEPATVPQQPSSPADESPDDEEQEDQEADR